MSFKTVGIRVLVALAFIGLIVFFAVKGTSPIDIAPLEEKHQIKVTTPIAVHVPVATRQGANAWTFSIDFSSGTAGTFTVTDVFVADIPAVNLAYAGPISARLPDTDLAKVYIVLAPLGQLAVGTYPVNIHLNFQPDDSSDVVPIVAETVFHVE